MEATANKSEKKKVAKATVKADEKASAKKVSKTWEAMLKYKDNPLIEIVDMRAVLK